MAREIVSSLRQSQQLRVHVHDFISRMDLAYSAADIVVSRAGAIAISELCIAGKPLMLVPLPTAAEDHQTRNALALSKQDAAVFIPDAELENKLAPELIALINNEQKQLMMKKNIREFARPDATEKIVDEVIKLLER